MSLRPAYRRRTSVSGSLTGSFFRSSPLMALKSAVFAPIPSASEITTMAVQPLAWSSIRTPWRRSLNMFQEKVAGAVFVGNAFGKLAGSTQVLELGQIETPIVLTNTLSVGTGVEGVVAYTLAQPGNEQVRSVNAVVGETNDGGLNDIRGFHVTREHVIDAIRNAKSGAVTEGAVGAGTGTICYGWKGGIGTSSRKVDPSTGSGRVGAYTVGVLAQTNFGGNLTISGVPIFKLLQPPSRRSADVRRPGPVDPASAHGSCMLVVATDAPCDARDLQRLARRAVFGLARTGSAYSNGSGDFAIAFSTSL